MNREKTLVKNTFIYAIGNFGSKILSFLLLPFYTYYLSTNDYGYYDLITAALSLLIPLVTFQVNDGLYRYLLGAENDNEGSEIISNSFFITIRNLVLFNIFYIIFIQFKSIKYEYIILLQIDFNILSGLWAQISRGLRHNSEYSVSGIICTIIILSSNIFFITVMKFKLGSLIASNILSSAAVIIYLDYRLKIHRYIKLKFKNRRVQKKLILFSIPLIPNMISWWFMNVSDRYFLNFYKGIQANGIYAVSNKFPSIIIMLNSIFYLAWQESAICEYSANDKNKFYTDMFNILMVIELTSVIVLLAFTRFIMNHIVDPKFYSAWLYVPFLYIGAAFSSFSSFYGTGYLSSEDTKGAFFTSVLGGAVNVLINFLLIPVIGIQGASLSTMISFLIMWLARVLQTRIYFKIYINYRKLISLSVICMCFTVLYYSSYKIIQTACMIISMLIFFIYNKNLITKGIGFLTIKINI